MTQLINNHTYWIAVGLRKRRARRMVCLAHGQEYSVFKGLIFNRAVKNCCIIAEYKEPKEKK